MSDHLSPTAFNALADGELSAPQLADANQHLAACPACTSAALHHSLLKSATARAGQRFTAPAHLQERLTRLISQEAINAPASPSQAASQPSPHSAYRFGFGGWASAALLLVCAMLIFQHTTQPTSSTTSQNTAQTTELAALATEVTDQHIATLAASGPPQVISTDRHTVKPWFQGKLPFSFNLPAELPAGITLDGANLTYLHSQPTAQLLFSIGKHRASVFLQQRTTPAQATPSAEHSGFHIAGFATPTLEAIAVSDADPARLAELVTALQEAQIEAPGLGPNP